MISVDHFTRFHPFARKINEDQDAPLFTALDIEIGARMANHPAVANTATKQIWAGLAAMICHHVTRTGHTYFDLTNPPEKILSLLETWPEIQFWKDLLAPFSGGEEETFVVFLPPGFLYLRKWWTYEIELAAQLSALSEDANPPLVSLPESALDPILVGCSNEQKRAVLETLHRRIILLTGGPGTGKTFTVLRCLAAILLQDPNCHIALAAPTGKAVARLTDAVTSGIESLDTTALVREKIPRSAMTLHRLLQSLDDSRHGQLLPRLRPPPDWVFIDEASMVDLRIMHRLLKRLPAACRVFLLGDIHQLASVDPGSVFADVYYVLEKQQERNRAISTIELRRPHRFTEDSALFHFCDSIKQGDAERVKKQLQANHSDTGLRWIRKSDEQELSKIEEEIVSRIYPIVVMEEPAQSLQQLRRMLILCATNRGPWGVERFNHRIHKRILQMALREGVHSVWVPFIVLENDYETGLFNGDMGIKSYAVLSSKSASTALVLKQNDVQVYVSEHQLPGHSTAYCMTVHKSQGSEAEDVVLFMPDADSPVLSREWLYTAASRAKHHMSIVSSWDAIETAVKRPIQRHSRLREIAAR